MGFLVAFAGKKPSQALPRQLSQRESQGLRLVAKVFGIMRKFSAVLLPLPLGEVALRSKDGEGARCGKYPLSRYATAPPRGRLSALPQSFPPPLKPSPWGRWLDAKRQDGRGIHAKSTASLYGKRCFFQPFSARMWKTRCSFSSSYWWGP